MLWNREKDILVLSVGVQGFHISRMILEARLEDFEKWVVQTIKEVGMPEEEIT